MFWIQGDRYLDIRLAGPGEELRAPHMKDYSLAPTFRLDSILWASALTTRLESSQDPW